MPYVNVFVFKVEKTFVLFPKGSQNSFLLESRKILQRGVKSFAESFCRVSRIETTPLFCSYRMLKERKRYKKGLTKAYNEGYGKEKQ